MELSLHHQQQEQALRKTVYCSSHPPIGRLKFNRVHGELLLPCQVYYLDNSLFYFDRLIEFFSPYCQHCKKFLPTWLELVTNKGHLRTDYPDAPFTLAQVNCFAQQDICVSEKVPHVPRLSVLVMPKCVVSHVHLY